MKAKKQKPLIRTLRRRKEILERKIKKLAKRVSSLKARDSELSDYVFKLWRQRDKLEKEVSALRRKYDMSIDSPYVSVKLKENGDAASFLRNFDSRLQAMAKKQPLRCVSISWNTFNKLGLEYSRHLNYHDIPVLINDSLKDMEVLVLQDDITMLGRYEINPTQPAACFGE